MFEKAKNFLNTFCRKVENRLAKEFEPELRQGGSQSTSLRWKEAGMSWCKESKPNSKTDSIRPTHNG
nr:MAG TPA: hypothetical protein [Caudoviricetes sp.]